MRVLVVVLVLFAAGPAGAEPETALIVDLNRGEASDRVLIKSIRKDLRLADYKRSKDKELRKSMISTLVDVSDWSKEEADLGAAQGAYENFELSSAIKRLESFDRMWRTKPSSKRALRLLARRYLLGGLVRFAEGNESKARDNFRLSHRLDPSVGALAASQYRPAVVALYAGAVQSNQESSKVSLRAAWTPASARLFVDGTLHDEASPLPAGPHLFSLEAAGYERAVFVKLLGKKTRLEASLEKAPRTMLLDELRRSALSGKVEDLGRLAKASGVGVLILVRREDELPTGAIYRDEDRSLSAWFSIGSLPWQAALSSGTSHSELALAPTPRSSSSGWHTTWWGGGLLVGGTVGVGTALYFLLSSRDSSGGGVTIDEWCFGSCN